MENVIATALANASNDENPTTGPQPPMMEESERRERIAAFFATEEGSRVLYEAVKNFMSTPEGIVNNS